MHPRLMLSRTAGSPASQCSGCKLQLVPKPAPRATGLAPTRTCRPLPSVGHRQAVERHGVHGDGRAVAPLGAVPREMRRPAAESPPPPSRRRKLSRRAKVGLRGRTQLNTDQISGRRANFVAMKELPILQDAARPSLRIGRKGKSGRAPHVAHPAAPLASRNPFITRRSAIARMERCPANRGHRQCSRRR
jgi:hypothetical protein